jgi:hypothetical protein
MLSVHRVKIRACGGYDTQPHETLANEKQDLNI